MLAVAAATAPVRRPARLEALPPRGERRPAGAEPPRGHAEPAAAPGPFARVLAGVRVLVVDDDADVLELFEMALRICGADVTAAATAREALALAARTRPHVVVSDIAMGGEDGYWLVGELRRLPDEAVARAPVLAATAYGREHPRQRVLAAGFTEHVQKPVDPDVLCHLVAQLVGRA